MHEIQQVRRFIVVDDDPTNNLVCEHILKRNFNHAHINLFTEPEKALRYISEHYSNVDERISTVILLDINMPIISGWEFLEEFGTLSDAVRSQFTIFMLSSSVDERDKEQAEKNPFVSGFFSKPLSIDQLTASIYKR